MNNHLISTVPICFCVVKPIFKMKLFIFVLFALFAIAFAKPNPNLMKAAEVGTSIVTVPGGAVFGGAGALVGSGGDPSKRLQGAQHGAEQGHNVAKNSGR